MKVAITTSDNQAVGFYRVRRPAEILHESGEIEANFIPELTIHGREIDGVRTVTHVDPPDADVLILQRPTNRFITDAIPFFQKEGIAVVVDLDDDLQRTADKHAQRTVYDPRHNPDENWQHLKRACKSADLVVISTPALRPYATHGRVQTVRNYVPESYLDIRVLDVDDRLTVGWGGTVLNHPGDLQVTHGGVASAVREAGALFKVVGDGEKVQQHLGLDDKPSMTGFVPISDYPLHVAGFDVGIAPLEESAFNEAKSWLKLLEYSALGVPWVASNNTSEYHYMTGFCSGIIVPDRARNWRRGVLSYLEDAELRKETAEVNRAIVRESLTMEGNVYRHAEAWQQAADNRRRA